MNSGISIVGYRPPHGWQIQMYIGPPGSFTCPTCGQPTQILLVPEGALTSQDQHCDSCIPGLRSVGE